MSPESILEVERIHYLDGGLITSVSPRLLEQNRGPASELLNFDFALVGIPTKRPGTATLHDPITGKEITSLFEYLKTTTGATHIFAGTKDGIVYRWNGTAWVVIKSGLDADPMWYINFADRIVFSNGEDTLMSWDGTDVAETLGEETAYMETFFPYSNNDLVFTAVSPGITGNYIQVEFIQPEADTDPATVALTGTGTEADPYVISVTLKYTAKVPQQYKLFLDSPTGGTFNVGNVFGFETVAYNISAADLKTALNKVYGAGSVTDVSTSLEADIDFIITFNNTFVSAYMKANFEDLEWAGEGSPNIEIHQEFEWDEILSTANEIKALLDSTPSVAALITTTHLGSSTGEETVVTLAKRSLTGGFDGLAGKYLTMFKNRIIMVTEDNKLSASHTGDPTLWSPYKSGSNAFETFIGTNDGTKLTGLLDMADGGLLIGKSNSLYGMFGYTRENFVVDLIDPDIGVVSHKTMHFIKPYALFVARDGVYRYEIGAIPERISFPIQEIFDDEVDHSRLAECSAVVINRAYILTMPTHTGTITLVYYPEFDKWSLWDEPAGFVYAKYLDNNKPLMYVEPEGNQIKTLVNSVSTDSGSAIDVVYGSMELDANRPEVEKYYGDLYIVFRNYDGGSTVGIEVSFNGEDFLPIATKETISGTDKKQVVLRVPLGREARFMQVRIVNKDKERHFSPIAMYYTYRLQGVL